jgi:cellulase
MPLSLELLYPHLLAFNVSSIRYLANCGGTTCTGVNAKTLKWFKIDQAGLLSGTVGSGSWANGKMIAQNSTWTSTIPASVPSGNYLIRFETIALHSLPAQFYPECAQINIVNGGSTAPSSSILVSLPGAYSNSDPGINIDLYSQASQTQTTYVIPGPPLYGGSGGTNPPPPPPTTSSTTARTTATTTAHTTTTTSTTVRTTSLTTHTTTTTASGGGGGTAPHWGQCGGIGWTGPTQCAAGTTCQVSNRTCLAFSSPYTFLR